MHRTQICLDEPLYEALRRLAFERRSSMATVVREALASYIADASPPSSDAAPVAPAGISDSPELSSGRGPASR